MNALESFVVDTRAISESVGFSTDGGVWINGRDYSAMACALAFIAKMKQEATE